MQYMYTFYNASNEDLVYLPLSSPSVAYIQYAFNVTSYYVSHSMIRPLWIGLIVALYTSVIFALWNVDGESSCPPGDDSLLKPYQSDPELVIIMQS